MTIREISQKVRKESLSQEELLTLYNITTDMLQEIGDLRSKDKKCEDKKHKIENARNKTALWSLRQSIRYRMN